MAKNWGRWGWKLGLMSFFAMGGARAFPGTRTGAQIIPPSIIPDKTLPVNSLVTSQGSTSLINGGTRAGGNLFHSFTQFSVPTGGTALFNNAVDVSNIFTRVTGGSMSTINGILRANGTANLFLLNPNGIIFGPNAGLDIRGSFVATTANALGFGNVGKFSATTPNNPTLLTVNPNALFLNQLAANSITNHANLEVPSGQSLLLVGGNVQIDGGQLLAPGGRVELGGLAGSGTIPLIVDGSNLRLSFPEGVQRADVSLSNGAEVNVRAGGGGSIVVNARNLDMSGGSNLRAGIGLGLGSVGSKAGNIELNTTGKINLSGGSFLANVVQSRATGKGGDIIIEAESLKVTDASDLIASTFGVGDAGNVLINVKNIASFDGADPKGPFSSSGIYSRVETKDAVGNGGNINLTAGSLFMTNGAIFTASTYGRGNAGIVNINVRDRVSFDGEGRNGNSSGAFSNVASTGVGQGGNVNITAGSLSFTNGATLQVSTFGHGQAGSININVRDLAILDGEGPDLFSTGIYNRVENQNAVGDGGNISIAAGSLFVTNGAAITASTLGQGNAGIININVRDTVTFDGQGLDIASSGAFNQVGIQAVGNGGIIKIVAGSLFVTHGAYLTSSTNGMGDAGIIDINVSDRIVLDGLGLFDPNLGFPRNSGIYSSVKDFGVGRGGNISLVAGTISITNGAIAIASTRNQGKGGNIQINAREVTLAGVGSNGQSSGLFTPTEQAAHSQAGEITVNTDRLRVLDGAIISSLTLNSSPGGNININAHRVEAINGGQIVTTTAGSGKAGNINLHVDGSIILSGSDRNFANRPIQNVIDNTGKLVPDISGNQGSASGLFANTEANSTGAGGNLTVQTGQLQILDGAQSSVSADGLGGAGNMGIETNSLYMDNSSFKANTTAGDRGNITIQAKDAQLRHQSNITTNALGTANGGNINFNSDTIIALENSDIRANAIRGQGGNIAITVAGIFGSPDSNIDASSQLGINGQVTIKRLDDPSRSVAPLRLELGQPVANFPVCQSSGTVATNSFTVSGTGGLPPQPNEVLNNNTTLDDLGASVPRARTATSSVSMPIVEAQALVKTADNRLLLVAQTPTGCQAP